MTPTTIERTALALTLAACALLAGVVLGSHERLDVLEGELVGCHVSRVDEIGALAIEVEALLEHQLSEGLR